MQWVFSFHVFSQKKWIFTIALQHEKWEYNNITSTMTSEKTCNDLLPIEPELQKVGRENLAVSPFGKSQQCDISERFSKLTCNTISVILPGHSCKVYLLGTLNSLLVFSFKNLILLINCYLVMPMFRNIQDSTELIAFVNKKWKYSERLLFQIIK